MEDLQTNERHAQLRSAAEALLEWMYARRAAWSDELADMNEQSEWGEPAPAAEPDPPREPAWTQPEPVRTLPEPVRTPAPAWTPPEPAWTPPEPAWTPPEPAWTAPEPAWTPPEPATSPEAAWAPPAPAWTPPASVFTPAVEPPPAFQPEPESDQRGGFADFQPVFTPRPAATQTYEPFETAKAPAVQPRWSEAPDPRRASGDTMRSGSAPLARGVRRAAPIAALLAIVVGAGWMGRPYLDQVKSWVTNVTTTEAPKPEVVVATPKPVSGGRPTGVLIAQSDPAGARVLVDGRDRGVTPLTLNQVTAGSHTVVIQSDKGSVKRTVTVIANKTALVSESIYAGWLSIYAPFEIEISEGSRTVGLDEMNRVLLPPGSHELRFENRALGYRETRTVQIDPGQTTSLSLVPPASTLNVTSNVPAVVLIDGTQVGETPLVNQPVALGTREILVRSADGQERPFPTKVTVTAVHIDVDFSKP